MKNIYEKDKKSFYLLLLGILVILTMVVGATFAYFSAQGGTSTTRNVNVTSNTTDLLTFEIDNDIELEITQADFSLGNGNKSGDTDARAILRPNNYNGEATDHYYMYLDIESNPTVYSSTNTNHDPELLLQVFDENDDLVEIDYFSDTVEYDGLEGYDITGVSGLIPILENYEIEATNNQTETQEWHIVITMINLDVDQEDNTGKTVEASIKLQKESLGLLTPVVTFSYWTYQSNQSLLSGNSNIVKYDDYNDVPNDIFIRETNTVSQIIAEEDMYELQYYQSNILQSSSGQYTLSECENREWVDSSDPTNYTQCHLLVNQGEPYISDKTINDVCLLKDATVLCFSITYSLDAVETYKNQLENLGFVCAYSDDASSGYGYHFIDSIESARLLMCVDDPNVSTSNVNSWYDPNDMHVAFNISTTYGTIPIIYNSTYTHYPFCRITSMYAECVGS